MSRYTKTVDIFYVVLGVGDVIFPYDLSLRAVLTNHRNPGGRKGDRTWMIGM